MMMILSVNQGGMAATHSISTFEFNGNFATPTHVRAGGFSVPKNWNVNQCDWQLSELN